MMDFEEWYKSYSGGAYNYMYTELGLQKAWDAAVDEAVKIVKEYDHPNDFIDANDFADGIAEKIKGGLKE